MGESAAPGAGRRLDHVPRTALTTPAAAPTTSVDVLLGDVRAALAKRFARQDDPLSRMLRHAVVPRGKLLRPLLVLCFAGAVGAPPGRVVPGAEAVEILHAGSLVHDDILDGDELRRGLPSVQYAYGTDRALLAGDALFFEVFTALTECADRGVPDRAVARACALAAEAGLMVCQGAVDELGLSGSWDRTPAEYLRMARGKTAALFRTAARLGVVLGGGTEAECEAAAGYGDALGVAFQLRDDILPWSGDDTAPPKPPASDLRNARPTMPLLLAWQHAAPPDRATLTRLLTTPHPDPELLARITPVLDRTGALPRTRALAATYAATARRALDRLPPSPYRDRLAEATTGATATTPAPARAR